LPFQFQIRIIFLNNIFLHYAIAGLLFRSFWLNRREESLNSEYCKKALEKVGNPNVLVNIVSRRVRQLTGGGGSSGARPLLTETAGMGAADIALLEIIEGKMSWVLLEEDFYAQDTPKKKGKKS